MRLTHNHKAVLTKMRTGTKLYRFSFGAGKSQRVTYRLGGFTISPLLITALINHKQLVIGTPKPTKTGNTTQLKLAYINIKMDINSTAKQIADHFMLRHNIMQNPVISVGDVFDFSMAHDCNASLTVTLANGATHTINCFGIRKAHMTKEILSKQIKNH